MTTKEVANRLIELCKKGQIAEAQQELFSQDAISVEPMGDNPTVKGLQAITEKGKKFDADIVEVHGSEISEPLISKDWFSIRWLFDATMKTHGRMAMDEICVYQVKDGKIVSEHFFYSM